MFNAGVIIRNIASAAQKRKPADPAASQGAENGLEVATANRRHC
jgi:hypothetical protein